ncbi:MAG: gamma-glutamyl-gamma-aminobutyrate hydrolase family protein [bacterium]|nr:gamma-glutamyl-gamma-aminobutyrate hydrolase family protein [bacterium]
MSKRPLIGVTCCKRNPLDSDNGNHYHQNANYSKMLQAAGSTAVFLPYTFDDWDILDGVIFAGGGDINPARGAYDAGGKGEAKGITDVRDDFELRLFHAATERELPMLGICRGIQFLNFMYGGTAVLDLAEAGYTENHRELHPVVLKEGTRAAEMFRGRDLFKSNHHQAVKTPGRGFTVSATSPEGVIEAVEHENGRILCFQFHPEYMGWPEPFVWLTELAKARKA